MTDETLKLRIEISERKGYKLYRAYETMFAVTPPTDEMWERLIATSAWHEVSWSELDLKYFTHDSFHDNCPDWTKTMTGAWELVEEIREMGHEVYLSSISFKPEYTFNVIDDNGEPNEYHQLTLVATKTAVTAAIAICKVWLEIHSN